MDFRSLGGMQVAAIGIGTWATFDVESEPELLVRRQIVDECLTNEVTFIDTSPINGKSEEVIGRVIEGRRDKFQIATKVWSQGREPGEAQIARSFELLGTEFIDLFQIHNLRDIRTQPPTLQRLKEEGKIGSIGITHYESSAFTDMIHLMESGLVDAVQVPYNIRQRDCEDGLLQTADATGVGVIAMETLGKGGLVNDLQEEPDLTPLTEFGISTWAQALLAWVLADSRITTAIVATSRPERIAENATAGRRPGSCSPDSATHAPDGYSSSSLSSR